MRRPIAYAALAATMLLSACAEGPAAPRAATLRGAVGFGALADFPDIDAQIARATIAVDALGTRVSRMPDPGRSKPVTFLTYKALDNNLTTTREEHLNILERAGSNVGINVVAVTDEEGPNNTFAYYVRKDGDGARVTSPYMPIWPGERDTGSAYTLAQATRWGFTQYPAGLRWLDVNDHGEGAFGIAHDERSGTAIRLPELAAALRVGSGTDRRLGRLDVVSFDACLMATAEVAYELRDAAAYMVASEDASLALGMNYDKTIAALEGRSYDAATLARALVLRAERRGPNRAILSLSAIDLGRAGKLAGAIDRLAGALLAVVPGHKAAIKRAIVATPRFHLSGDDPATRIDKDHRDLAALATALRTHVPDAGVRAACEGVHEALFGRERVVVMAVAAPEQKNATQGLSIHVRADGVVDPQYRRTALARDTRWDELIAALR